MFLVGRMTELGQGNKKNSVYNIDIQYTKFQGNAQDNVILWVP